MTDLARRRVLTGLAAAPLAAILADARLARAAAAGLEEVSLTTEGGRQVTAALARPEQLPAHAVLLIHEWWGLNDQIKTMAAELASKDYLALAVDLYGGQSATDPAGAKALMEAVETEQATDTLVSWITWLRRNQETTGRIGTVGWCFGGGWSLNASVAVPVDATVVYYGRVDQPAQKLAELDGPVLGHFATRDDWINKPMVEGFETAMASAGKEAEIHWYDAEHGFANPTAGRYDREDAELAWSRTLAFYARTL